MELSRHEVRVLRDLDDLDQLFLGPDAGDAQAVLLEPREVVVVHLVAMAVALLDDSLAVEARGEAPLAEDDGIVAQPHRAALVGDAPLVRAAAPSRSMCSASIHRTSTRASFAMPPWASASTRLL